MSWRDPLSWGRDRKWPTLGTKLTIAAGGAAAIFVILYFFIPAGA